MRRIQKFFSLPARDRLLLVKSAFIVTAVRLGLWLLPLQTLCRMLAKITPSGTNCHNKTQDVINSVGWAVTTSSQYVPGATCLTQALATKVLLRQSGQESRLRIGIARSKEGRLEAHAWVESEESIVIGNVKDLSRYTSLGLLPLEREKSSTAVGK